MVSAAFRQPADIDLHGLDESQRAELELIERGMSSPIFGRILNPGPSPEITWGSMSPAALFGFWRPDWRQGCGEWQYRGWQRDSSSRYRKPKPGYQRHPAERPEPATERELGGVLLRCLGSTVLL